MPAPRKRRGKDPAAAMPPVSGLPVVTFIRPHQHRGVDYIAGDQLPVDASTREKLLRFGAIADA